MNPVLPLVSSFLTFELSGRTVEATISSEAGAERSRPAGSSPTCRRS